jgi:peptidoglycan/LPS O-acetylase OafA/YrhL
VNASNEPIENSPKRERNHALDGLRGLAALIVVLHHFTQTQPWFADRFLRPEGVSPRPWTNTWQNWLEGTPLHFFHAGPEAVFIFFVLSGYVLFPVICRSNLNVYVRTRLVRLYGPVVASVLLAELLLKLAPHGNAGQATWWLNFYPDNAHVPDFLRSLYLLDGTSSINSVLWSMKYEVLFSLLILGLLPVKQPIVPARPLRLVGLFAGLTGLVVMGAQNHLDVLTYMPMFFAGVVLHYVPTHRIPALLEFVIGVLVLIGPWLVWTGGHSLSGPYAYAWNTLGAVLMVDSVRHSGTVVSRALGSRPMRVLGAHSYSLYLVHVPVILAVWYTFGTALTNEQTWKLIAWSVVDIVILTALFYRYIERPCLTWIAKYKIANAPAEQLAS